MLQTTGYKFAVISEKDSSLPFLLMSAGKGTEHNIYRPNGISHHQLLFSVSGTGAAIINGKEITISENMLMYHEPNTPHIYHPLSGNWLTAWITFEQKPNFFSAKSGVYHAENMNELTELCDELINIEQNILYEEKATVVLYKLLISAAKNTENSEDCNKILPAMEYIEKNYLRDISLEDLSSLCCMTREYFCRLFKKQYHTTAFSYIKNMRIQESKKLLLQNKNDKLSQTAEAVGYKSLNYFLTDFKKNEGITPSEFRRRHFG